jgi:hypothetical protein
MKRKMRASEHYFTIQIGEEILIFTKKEYSNARKRGDSVKRSSWYRELRKGPEENHNGE